VDDLRVLVGSLPASAPSLCFFCMRGVVVLLEGRDASGKTTTARDILEALGPGKCRVIALPPPSDEEKRGFYFRRWAERVPREAGEVVVFDRSWYNRAVVERVMGFCTPEEAETFLDEVPRFESELVSGGLGLVKIFIEISEDERARRLEGRRAAGRLTEVDAAALARAEAYSEAERAMLDRTSTSAAPWIVLRGSDRQERLDTALAHIAAALRAPRSPHGHH
jgi:polyphosphate kinase 2 (PPK2 family)